MNVNEIVFFKDELLLLRWGDNSRDGQTVTFQLPGEYEIHPFKHSATGKKTGKRYAAVLVEINDDETPVKQKGGPLSREAAGMCKRDDFQRYVASKRIVWQVSEDGERTAAKYIRRVCAVSSRSEIDHNLYAKDMFSEMKREFVGWCR